MANPASLISSSVVQGAYRNGQSLTGQKIALPDEATQGTDFAQMIKTATGDAVATVREAEAVTQAGLRGEVSTQEVVEAAMAMEATVQIAVSMRDKFVQAYQEILRMPI